MNDAELMKRFRHCLGFTQAGAADRLGYNAQSAVARIEAGQKKMSKQARLLIECIIEKEDAMNRDDWNTYYVKVWGHDGQDYRRDLDTIEFKASDDQMAMDYFNEVDWDVPESGYKLFALMIDREGPQGDSQCLAEKSYSPE